MAWNQQQQYSQQYHQQNPNMQQYQQHSQSVRSLNNQPAHNQQYNQQQYNQQQYNQQQYNQYYANQQKRQQYNPQQQQYAQRLMTAHQSSQPPVASPFLQAQQQKQQMAQQQQRQQWNASQQPGAAHVQTYANNGQVRLIADSTPPGSDDENDTYNQSIPPPTAQTNYNNDNIATVQLRMHQLIASQEKMIDELRKNEESLTKQLKERDDHWRQSLTNSLNKKDLRINVLFQETLDLQQQNKGEQMKNVELKQVIMRLRSESSKILFTSKKLPGLPGVQNTDEDIPPPPSMLGVSSKDSVSIVPEDKEVEEEEQKEEKKDENAKDNKEKSKTDNHIGTENAPKESKKKALEALFSSRKNLTEEKTSQSAETKTDDSEINPIFVKYMKMKKLNMPMKTIVNKMKLDGVKPDLIAQFQTGKKKKANIEDNPALQKYVKMKKIGMPMVSVINKMRMDGIDKALIAAFNGETNGDDDDDDDADDNGPKIDLNDPKFDKYKKMKKLNMPINSVKNKMRMDGFKPDEIEAFINGGSVKKKKKKQDKKTQMQELAVAMGLKPKQPIAPQRVKKLKRIHWKVIELKDIKSTFWEQINKDYDDDNAMNLGSKFELEFQIRARKPRLRRKTNLSAMLNLQGRSGNKKRNPKDRITWIGGKRDQNIQIGLKTMGISNEQIYDAIVDMDDKVMTLTRLETIFELTPDVDEQRKAEEKIDQLGDKVELCGPSELFHIEMSSIPEVRAQLAKWLFCVTFKELYMDRLQQVTNIIKGCYAIKESSGLKIYLRILLQMGNLMNHGIMDKSMVYGFDLESLSLLDNIKNFGGNKTLAMYLYEYAYNRYAQVRAFEEELSVLKAAVRTETAAIETSIKQMADEFLNIDLFCRRINDEYHEGDTMKFREYMKGFSDLQTINMMNLKVKIQNAQRIAENVASYYGITLAEGKPELLFQTVQRFVDIMDKSKRALIKMEKERQKLVAKKAKEKEKARKKAEKKKGGGALKKMKLTVSELMSRKKEKQIEEEEKGNVLFHDIKMAAAKFSQRQKKMEKRLSVHFVEKAAMAKGEMTESMRNDKIKKRVSQQMGTMGVISEEEAEKLRDGDHHDKSDEEFDDDELRLIRGNSLMVPE